MARWSAGFIQQLPAPSMVRCESRPSTIGHITLGTKQTGAPSAGNPHAGCDVAGAGNGFTVWLLRHSQRKRGETARLDLRNTAPVLDPTGSCCWTVVLVDPIGQSSAWSRKTRFHVCSELHLATVLSSNLELCRRKAATSGYFDFAFSFQMK